MADGAAKSPRLHSPFARFAMKPIEHSASEPPPLATIDESGSATRRRGKRGLFGLLALALLGGGGAAAVLPAAPDGV